MCHAKRQDGNVSVDKSYVISVRQGSMCMTLTSLVYGLWMTVSCFMAVSTTYCSLIAPCLRPLEESVLSECEIRRDTRAGDGKFFDKLTVQSYSLLRQ